MPRKRTKSIVVLEAFSVKELDFAGLVADLGKILISRKYKGAPSLLEMAEALKSGIEHQRLRTLLSRMKKQGLLASHPEAGGFWYLTAKGKALLQKQTPSLVPKYVKQAGSEVMVVSYDIPERLRKERHWLRGALKLLGLEMVHKSLWIGKVVLPEAFFDELARREILDTVHVFAIGKEGTLKRVS